MVLIASVSYAYAVIMILANLPLVDGIAINGLAMAITTIFWGPAQVFPNSHYQYTSQWKKIVHQR
jgi:hypothetical protein